MNPKPPETYTKIAHEFSNLTVKVVALDYLMGMKLTSARVQDIKDVATILSNDGNTEPFLLMSKLKGMEFDIDISLLLEAFGLAHGMVWLENFYKDNEERLIGLF